MTVSDTGQISMPLDGGAPPRQTFWLGLATDHRRLFDALEEGWLRPAEPRTGFVLGVGTYAADRDEPPAGRPIPVRVRLDAAKLPVLDVFARRDGSWVSSSPDGLESTDAALYWPGVLPTFAVVGVSVSTDEERRRLKGLAQAVSNVDLADLDIDVDADGGGTVEPGNALPDISRTLDVPDDEDAVYGAMSMAVWAVPRIDPWLDVLVASLGPDRARLPEVSAAVDACWWKFPPWVRPSDGARPAGVDECLWLAAVDVFRDRPADGHPRPRDLAERIAAEAARLGGVTSSDAINAWLKSTHRIVRAESTIDVGGWRACPVGLALQLVLNRPEPQSFATWFHDRPDLPPPVAWSGAALCGLLGGYRKLNKGIRGDRVRRELLSIHALRTCGGTAADVNWPSLPDEAPRWRKERGQFVLSWGSSDFARKPDKARGRWYGVDFKDDEVRRRAQAVAKKQGWACIHREIELTEGRFPLSGSGGAEIVADGSERRLQVRGAAVKLRRLPAAAEIKDVFDEEAFRRAVAVEAGALPDPPVHLIRAAVPASASVEAGALPDPSVQSVRVAQPQTVASEARREHRGAVAPECSVRSEQTEVPGLMYVRDFISPQEEEEIVAEIDQADWISDLQRRVQHYGWRYDYKARQIDASMRLGSLPEWAERLARKLESSRLLPDVPDQVIVNEYVEKQGIAKHVDSESFADGIATISLLESWEMVFRKGRGRGGRKVEQRLDRRSVAIMTGDARYRWTHEIPPRKNEPGRVPRGRRISLTFRKVLAPASRQEERRHA